MLRNRSNKSKSHNALPESYPHGNKLNFSCRSQLFRKKSFPPAFPKYNVEGRGVTCLLIVRCRSIQSKSNNTIPESYHHGNKLNFSFRSHLFRANPFPPLPRNTMLMVGEGLFFFVVRPHSRRYRLPTLYFGGAGEKVRERKLKLSLLPG